MIDLEKLQKAEITKGAMYRASLIFGIGWDASLDSNGNTFDLDASAFLLGVKKRILHDTDVIYYNNLENYSGAVIHLGDNLTGFGEGDDEQILVDLEKMPSNIESIDFCVTIHDAEAKGQVFSQVPGAYVHIMDGESGEDLVRYELGRDFPKDISVIAGKMYRHAGEWKFIALGEGFRGSLDGLVRYYGGDI